SDGKHHLVAQAVEAGLNVILLTHYAAENYGFHRFYENMKKLLEKSGVACEYCCDERFL
ncbi:MAG: Nif3-like dinuclear metal center hexameric protein, partial [Clostridiales bacterium]|nr:Nif3-like dinuclear metal center hexameric protein [Clostridiales bacterium]